MKPISNSFVHFRSTVFNTEGMAKVSDFALAALALYEQIYEKIPKRLDLLQTFFRPFSHFGIGIQLLKRVDDWSVFSRNAPLYYSRLAFLATLTIGYCLSLVNVIGIATLIQAFDPEKLAEISFAICCLCDWWVNTKTYRLSIPEKVKNDEKRRWWMECETLAWNQSTQECQEKIRNEFLSDPLSINRDKWIRVLQHCNNEEILLKYCQAKVRRWNAKFINCERNTTKSGISVIYDIIVIASFALGIILPAFGKCPKLCKAVLQTFGITVDLQCYLLDVQGDLTLPSTAIRL